MIQQFGRFHDSPVRSSVMGNSQPAVPAQAARPPGSGSNLRCLSATGGHESRHRQLPGTEGVFASFVYYREDDGKPVIAHGRNQASQEMLYATASDGTTFERRARELKGEGNITERIAAISTPTIS